MEAKLRYQLNDREISDAAQRNEKILKVLVLGAKGSGKYTIVIELHSMMLNALKGPCRPKPEKD